MDSRQPRYPEEEAFERSFGRCLKGVAHAGEFAKGGTMLALPRYWSMGLKVEGFMVCVEDRSSHSFGTLASCRIVALFSFLVVR